MHKRSVTIRELPGKGWLWKEHGRTYKTAAGAARAVNRDSKVIAKSHGASIVLITWEPVTEIGSAIVAAITTA